MDLIGLQNFYLQILPLINIKLFSYLFRIRMISFNN